MAGAACKYYADPGQQYPVVDHDHSRLHQHQSFWASILGKKPTPDLHPNYPDADMIDYGHLYVIEVEVPGVKDVGKLSIRWIDSCTLSVKGDVHSANRALEQDAHGDDAGPWAKLQVHPYVLVHERRIGTFERRFTFPMHAVEGEQMTAKLQAGLLTLRIPKHEQHIRNAGKEVEVVSED